MLARREGGDFLFISVRVVAASLALSRSDAPYRVEQDRDLESTYIVANNAKPSSDGLYLFDRSISRAPLSEMLINLFQIT